MLSQCSERLADFLHGELEKPVFPVPNREEKMNGGLPTTRAAAILDSRMVQVEGWGMRHWSEVLVQNDPHM